MLFKSHLLAVAATHLLVTTTTANPLPNDGRHLEERAAPTIHITFWSGDDCTGSLGTYNYAASEDCHTPDYNFAGSASWTISDPVAGTYVAWYGVNTCYAGGHTPVSDAQNNILASPMLMLFFQNTPLWPPGEQPACLESLEGPYEGFIFTT